MKKGGVALLTGGVSFGFGLFLGGKMLVGMINDYKRRMERNLSNMMLLNDWVEFIYSGNSIDKFFHDHKYSKIMIYGYGYIGTRLMQALGGTDIEVTAVMDKSVSSDKDKMLIGIDREVPDVDCIVVTPVFHFDEINGMLKKKTNIPVIPIDKILEKPL